MKLILAIALLVVLVATVFSAPATKEQHNVQGWSPMHGPFGASNDGIEESSSSVVGDHNRSKRWGGWGWGRPWGMGWGRPWGMYRPWGMGYGMGMGGYGGYGWGR